jgi:hypothetical protein
MDAGELSMEERILITRPFRLSVPAPCKTFWRRLLSEMKLQRSAVNHALSFMILRSTLNLEGCRSSAIICGVGPAACAERREGESACAGRNLAAGPTILTN